NESFASRLFGTIDPLGHTIRLPDRREARVVGVARNSKYMTVGEENVLAMYEPFAQRADVYSNDEVVGRAAVVFLRVHGAPGSFLRGIDAVLSKPNPANAVEVRPMRD